MSNDVNKKSINVNKRLAIQDEKQIRKLNNQFWFENIKYLTVLPFISNIFMEESD